MIKLKNNEKVRIEIRFDAVDDKDMIDFIDNNGSTRAGFIKQVLKMYKNKTETMIPATSDIQNSLKNNDDKISSTQEKRKKLSTLSDTSFSSKDFE